MPTTGKRNKNLNNTGSATEEGKKKKKKVKLCPGHHPRC
jgi:hypothetical protein